MPRSRACSQRFHAGSAIACLALIAATPCGADVIHVNVAGLPGGDGASWDTAFNDLHEAIGTASGGDEIWVAMGTYRPAPAAGDRSASFDLFPGVGLYGGFDGTETRRDQRDPQGNETVLCGDLDADDGDPPGTLDDNSFHVVRAVAVDETTVLDGFTVTGGRAVDPLPAEEQCGGGLLVAFGTPTITGCLFRGNVAGSEQLRTGDGAAVAAVFASLDLDQCRFSGNCTGGAGAAVSVLDGELVLRHCQFTENESFRDGGAVAMVNGALDVLQCTFQDNRAWDRGGSILVENGTVLLEDSLFHHGHADQGGAICLANASATIEACLFKRVSADDGGAICAENTDLSVLDCEFLRTVAIYGGAINCSVSALTVEFTRFDRSYGAVGGSIYGLESQLNVTQGTFTCDGCLPTAQTANIGGGIAARHSAVDIQSSEFRNLGAGMEGGAIHNHNSPGRIEDCVFVGNRAEGDEYTTGVLGGAIYNCYSSPTIRGCVFIGNKALAPGLSDVAYGGAIANLVSDARIIDCEFRSNLSGDFAGAVAIRADSAVSVVDCRFVGNKALFWGGGAIHLSFNSTGRSEIRRCTFQGNIAGLGGAVSSYASALQMHQCHLLANRSVYLGGAIGLIETEAEITSCLLAGNSSLDRGGAVAALNCSQTTLVNCTLWANNAAELGGGIYVGPEAFSCDDAGELFAANCIFWGNRSPGDDLEGSQVHVDPPYEAAARYSCIEGLSDGLAGPGNIGIDPEFVDMNGADGMPGTEDDDLHLAPGSPCIDAGENQAVPWYGYLDLDQLPRFVDDPGTPDTGLGDPPVVDMGAFEAQLPSCPADIAPGAGDGAVGELDIAAVLDAWGSDDPGADVDFSGIVDVDDLIAVILAWGPCP